MNWIVWLFLVTTIVFFSIAIFLGGELLRKFRFHTLFSDSKGYIQQLVYIWPGGRKPEMRNIVLEGGQPFKVLVGFKLIIPLIPFMGTDWFGFLEARERMTGGYYAVISTFMWKKPVEFRLLVNSQVKDEVKISSSKEDQSLTPHLTCPPHIFQRLGFYA